MTDKKQKNRRAYHHGNLKAALIDVAQRLIVERGPHGFTLVEAAKLAGVSPAAPYRHFSSREALLAEVARSGYENFSTRLEDAWDGGTPNPVTAFRRMGDVYLDFARYERASYIAMFEAGLVHNEVDGLKSSADKAFSVLTNAASALGGKMPDGTPIPPEMLGAHIWAMSHGMATLFASTEKFSDQRLKGDMKALFESGTAIYLRGLGIDVPPINDE